MTATISMLINILHDTAQIDAKVRLRNVFEMTRETKKGRVCLVFHTKRQSLKVYCLTT
jgi:hypothetical protein